MSGGGRGVGGKGGLSVKALGGGRVVPMCAQVVL